ncbi:MAG: DNA-formamidopyrimidine glycosylase family protein [Planctomycetota bacterium]
MPELPEVETMCRGIRSIVGRRVIAASTPPCACRPCLIQPGIDRIHAAIAGRTITAIERRGKRVMLRLEGNDRLIIEPRMTGLVLLADPPDPDHLRLRLELSSVPYDSAQHKPSAQMLVWDRRGLGTIRLMNEDDYREHIDNVLGVDALVISCDQLRDRAASSRRPIKVALLDQTKVAGIGNLYAAEMCFVAGIDPRTRCDRLTGPQWKRLHAAISKVLLPAIEAEGSTLSDGTYRNALNRNGGYQNMHRVYDKADTSCPRCHEGRIRRIVQAQRSTFFCPKCQRRSGCHHLVAC